MFRSERFCILAEGEFGVMSSKTAACIIRYQPYRVACVIDSTQSGRSVREVLGFGGDIPVVGGLTDALAHSPDALLIGIAPRGGMLPGAWRRVVLQAIEQDLDVVSGLHTMLSDDPEIGGAARAKEVRIWDVRRPVIPDRVAEDLLRRKKGTVVLTVGTDSRSGKMTVAYELARYLRENGITSTFVPTGQTGVILDGWGVVVDRVPGDFMSKVVEDLTLRALSEAQVAVVEGQGSLIHPAYSGVALAIMHGCYPDAMIMCHHAGRARIRGFDIPMPSMRDMVDLYENLCRPVFPSRVTAVAVNTYEVDEDHARAETSRLAEETGLPVTDPVRWGCDGIFESLRGIL